VGFEGGYGDDVDAEEAECYYRDDIAGVEVSSMLVVVDNEEDVP
jgi:hypothetical protein